MVATAAIVEQTEDSINQEDYIMSNMRAKMNISNIEEISDTQETLHFSAVCSSGYDKDGLDEDNTYAQFTPYAELKMGVANPALIGAFKVGQTFYVDFTEVRDLETIESSDVGDMSEII